MLGGLMYILQNMKVKEVLIGIQHENSEQLNTLIKIIKEKNIKLSILEADMKIKILENGYIDVLWPIKENLVKNTLKKAFMQYVRLLALLRRFSPKPPHRGRMPIFAMRLMFSIYSLLSRKKYLQKSSLI